MGADVTVDKHTTPIEDWLEVMDKLDSIAYQEQVVAHVAAWKLFMDEANPQEFNCLPVQLDLNAVHQLISPHETYLIYAIRNDEQPTAKTNQSALSALIHSIRQNIEETTASTYIVSGSVDHYSYRVYAYLGKLSKSKIKLVALSFALKIEKLLGSRKKLAILSSGGVLRSKKLQKGSTLPLLANLPSGNKEILDHTGIDIFSFFWTQTKKNNPLLAYRGNRDSPFIFCPEAAPKVGGIKPPLLKLSLKPFQEVTYSAIEEQQNNGQIKFDIRATARHELKMSKFQGECSEIIDGIFVGGEKVAKSWQMFEKHKIKAVINCAGDYCQNWHQGKSIPYLTFFLKDSQNENIQCLFYRAIEFIQNCQKNKNNVLVHCIQGISRSITIVIAYIIFKLGYDYKKAEHFVKQKRGIACPNNGFMVQLIQFHKRLYEDYSALPLPRVFLVSSHSKQTPNLITARLIKQPLFDEKKYVGLDCRGIYIVQATDIVYIWVGSKCQEKRLQNYWSYAQEYVKKLQKYERASIKLKAISQGTQGKEFFALWNLEDAPLVYENPQYTRLFSEGEGSRPGGMRKFYEREIEQEHPKKLFIYPDFQQGLGVFQYEDLGGLSILVVSQDQNLKVFICKQQSFKGDQNEIGEYLDNVLKNHYGGYEPDQIAIEEENLDSPSEGFLRCFS